jgi:regulatory protein
MSNTYEKSINYALRLLSKKRYTTFEMGQKIERFLKKREQEDSKIIEDVIARLKELKYLDDQQYAIDFCNDRIKFKPSGKFLLRYELKKRGISKEFAEKALDSIETDEYEVGMDALERKSKQWNSKTQKQLKEKAYRFLGSRGFSPDTIYKIINNCYDRKA